MHFFNGRLKPLFMLRGYRAQFKHSALSRRLRAVISLDYFDGAIQITKYRLKVGE